MKKLLITFFTVLFCMTSSVGWSETMDDLIKRDTIYYKKFTEVPFSGKVDGKKQGSLKNGKKEGSWVEYFDNGQLVSKGEYKNGKEEGSWISYWKNGQLFSKGDFKDGKEEGSWVRYHDNGQLFSKGDYKNGKREGSWVKYFKDRTIVGLLTGTYKDGVKISD